MRCTRLTRIAQEEEIQSRFFFKNHILSIGDGGGHLFVGHTDVGIDFFCKYDFLILKRYEKGMTLVKVCE